VLEEERERSTSLVSPKNQSFPFINGTHVYKYLVIEVREDAEVDIGNFSAPKVGNMFQPGKISQLKLALG